MGGIRVLAFTHYAAAIAPQYLGSLGADVAKMEVPTGTTRAVPSGTGRDPRCAGPLFPSHGSQPTLTFH
ncbi:CoA transferase [Mesorhizobium sp. M0129]|uniref:CoA transferase n=1 Tax=Mesorhizobium sp. M0129 TaxID=2956886 RepID=UPI003334DBF4